MAFIVPVRGSSSSSIIKSTTGAIVPWRGTAPYPLRVSSHPGYDVAAVSTYIAYFMAQYWGGSQMLDVEFFAIVMGLWWQLTHDHDALIFLLLWVIGGVSHFVAGAFAAGGNREESANFWVGVRAGGYMSFLLLAFDLLGILAGY